MNHGIERIQEDFPLLKEVVWLASAGVGPMPRTALSAMAEVQSRLYERLDPAAWEEEYGERCRKLVARLLAVAPEEIALGRSTTEGLNAIAGAIPWQHGDTIVITDQEYLANVVPWYHQAHRHDLEVRVVPSENGRLPLGRFEEVIDRRTRVVAVSHVQFASGFRTDLAALAELAHAHEALVIVDGIQAVGTLRVQPQELGIDVLACGGYKWLCGPLGTGFLYVRRELADELTPMALGYEQISAPEYEAIRDALRAGGTWVRDFSRPAAGAKRFDGVGLNPALLSGLAAAVEYFLDLGLDWIEERVLELSGRLIERLREEGYSAVTPEERKERAGIVLFRGPWDLSSKAAREELEKRLLAAGVVASIRAGGIRASCHFFNTEEDFERLLEALAQIELR